MATSTCASWRLGVVSSRIAWVEHPAYVRIEPRVARKRRKALGKALRPYWRNFNQVSTLTKGIQHVQ